MLELADVGALLVLLTADGATAALVAAELNAEGQQADNQAAERAKFSQADVLAIHGQVDG